MKYLPTTVLSALLLAACEPAEKSTEVTREVAAGAVSGDPEFPPVAPRSEPYNTAPGRPGVVLIKNTFDHAVSVSLRDVGSADRCPGAVGAQVITLQPNEEKETSVAEGRKVCFSMGADLTKPLASGICEARGGDRVALAAYAGCYRM